MPYRSIQDLPASVKDNLPHHAQEIYKEAYNNAFKQYKDPNKRKDSSSREETSHKVAWSAVEKKYHKKDGKWTQK